MQQLSFKMWLLGLLLLASAASWAQGKRVTGKVVGADDNQGLPGVSVMVKGTTHGTQTDENGNFVLTNVNASDVLVASFVGYGSVEKAVGNETDFSFTLSQADALLNEVVVVGYGTQSRKNVTSSIGKLNTEVLANAPRANIGSSLQGSLAGIQVINRTGSPGAVPSILLRGGASINSPGSPLVVVDGVIRSYSDIAPDDIESIELLKDAAATAIYGARANNGVILITTRQGKSGKPRIGYKYTVGYNQNREGYQYMNARDYIYYNRLGNLNSQRTLAQVNSSRGYGLQTDAANLALFDIRANTPANADLLTKGWQQMDDPYGGSILYKDHSGEIENLLFRNTNTQDHYFNVEGGTERGRYFASLNRYSEDGVIVGSSYQRYVGNINGTYKITPKLEATTAVTASTAQQYGTLGAEANYLYRNLAIWPTMNPWLDAEKTKPNPGTGITDGNPLYWLNKTQRTNETNRFILNGSIKYDILRDLYVKLTANGYLFESLGNSFTQATQSYVNIFANPPSFSSTTRNAFSGFNRSFQKQYNGVINYTKNFDRHHTQWMLGAEMYDTKGFRMQVLGQNAPTDDIPTANASTTFAAGDNFTFRDQFRILSQFSRLNYDFDERYLLTLVARRDGVSSLAGANRWGFFPGMSAGWNMHKEAFFANAGLNKYIDVFKPRFSYGVNGNIAGIGNYEVQGVYGSQGNYNGSLGFLNTGIVNNDLRWERSKTVDVGLDMAVLNNRLSFIFDWYDRRTNDLLTNLTLPSYVGYASVRTNLGTFQNKGFEFTTNATLVRRPNGLLWNLGANITFVKNKILQLPFNGNEFNRQGGFQIWDPAQNKVVWVGGLQEGQPLGAIYAYKQVSIFRDEEEVARVAGNRIDNIAGIGGPNTTMKNKISAGDVNWQDVNEDGIIDTRDQVYIGNINPKYTGGFNSSLSYKAFAVFTRFDFALGHTIYNDLVARTLGNFQGTFNYLEMQKQAWSADNRDTDIPKVYYADQVGAPAGKKNYTRGNNGGASLNGNNSRFYERGDYLACRELTVSYDLAQGKVIPTRWLPQARVYVNMNNLFYLTKFSGPSPEAPENGVYLGTYPVPKSFILGVQVGL